MIGDANPIQPSTDPNVAKQLQGINDNISGIKVEMRELKVQPSEEFLTRMDGQNIELRQALDKQTKTLSAFFAKDSPKKPDRQIAAIRNQHMSNQNQHTGAIDSEISEAIKIHKEKAVSIIESTNAVLSLDKNVKDFLDRISNDFKIMAENQRKLDIKEINPEENVETPRRETINAGLATPTTDATSEAELTQEQDREQRYGRDEKMLGLVTEIRDGIGTLGKKPKDEKAEEKKKEEKGFSMTDSMGLMGGLLEKFLPKMMSGVPGMLKGLFSVGGLASMAGLGALGYTAIKTAKAYTDVLEEKGKVAEGQQTVSNKITSQTDTGANLGREAQKNVASAHEKIGSGNVANMTNAEILDIMRRDAGIKFDSIVEKFRKQSSMWGIGVEDDTDLTNAQATFTNAIKAVKDPSEVNPVLMDQVNKLLAAQAKKDSGSHEKIGSVKFEKLTVNNPLGGDAEKNAEVAKGATDRRDASVAESEQNWWYGKTIGRERRDELERKGRLSHDATGYKVVIPSPPTKPIGDGLTMRRING